MLRRLNSQSPLYRRAILFVILVCVTMLGLDFWRSWELRSVRLQQTKSETANLARSLAQYAQDVLENADATLKGLRSTLVEEGSDPNAMSHLGRRMHARVVNQGMLERLFLYDENGHWIASSLDRSAFNAVRNLNYTDRDYFRYHHNHADDVALVGPPIQTKLNGAWVITITRRLTFPDGRFAGVVGASISLDLFQSFFQTFDIGKRAAITLTTGQGILIVRRPFDLENVGRSITQSQFFQAIQANADSGSFEFVSFLDGRARLGSFYRVPGFDLVMIVAFDKNEVLASWWHDMEVHIAWVVIVVAVMALIGYQVPLQIRHRAFVEAQLALSQQTLERRVVERTADLQQMVNQRDLLLREVYHRVKNNMQVVDALLAMETKHLKDANAQQVLVDMRTRVMALGLAHQQLMVSADLETFDFAPFLRELATSVLTDRAGRDISLTIEAIPLMVTMDFAAPMGLVVSELMTNCLKQTGSPGNGHVSIRLERGHADTIVLTVANVLRPHTAPEIKDPARTARRTRLIDGLVRQIDGTVSVYDDDNACYAIVCANPGVLT